MILADIGLTENIKEKSRVIELQSPGIFLENFVPKIGGGWIVISF